MKRSLAFFIVSLPLYATPDNLGQWMAIGDSVTHGTYGYSYRWYLQKTLIDNGIAYDAVGYHAGNYTTTYSSAAYGGQRYDNEHSAQFNIRTYEVAGTGTLSSSQSRNELDCTNVKNWLGVSDIKSDNTPYTGTTSSPDTYTMMLGLNDLGTGSTAATVQGHIASIVDTIAKSSEMNHKCPTVYLMGATVTNSKYRSLDVPAYDALLKDYADHYSNEHVTLVYVDTNRGLADVSKGSQYMVEQMSNDWAHINNQGSLLVAGNVAQAMGYAGRSAGLDRKATGEFSIVQHANGFAGPDLASAAQNISLTDGGGLEFSAKEPSSISFSWGNASLEQGCTVDFLTTLGDGSQNGWDTTHNLSLTINDGFSSGTLNINEAYILWGDTILYSRDMSKLTYDAAGAAESLRVSYITGEADKGLSSGYYVWLGDMLIGEALQGSAVSQKDAMSSKGVTLSYSGNGSVILHRFAMDNAACAPTSSGYVNPDALYHATLAERDDWSLANGGAKDTALISGNRKTSDRNGRPSAYYANYAGDKDNLGDCTIWDFAQAADGDSKSDLVVYGLGDRTDSIRVRLSGQNTGYHGVYGVRSKQDMSQTGTLTGDIYLQLDAAQATYGFIAGAYNHSITGEIGITLNAGTVAGDLVGGATYATQGQSIGRVALRIQGGEIQGSVIGGSTTDSGVINGSTSVTITGGTIKGDVRGGGTAGSIGGSSSVTITAGTIEGNVYGGQPGNETDADSGITIQGTQASVKGAMTAGCIALRDMNDANGAFASYANVMTAPTVNVDEVTVALEARLTNVRKMTARASRTQLQLETPASLRSLELDNSELALKNAANAPACLSLQELVVLNGSSLRADLQLRGTDLILDDTLTQIGILTLNHVSLSGALYNSLRAGEQNSVTLIQGITLLQLPDGRNLEDDYLFTADELAALINGIDGAQYALAYTASSGSLVLSSRSVPEPGTVALSLLALGAFALRRRRHHEGGRA